MKPLVLMFVLGLASTIAVADECANGSAIYLESGSIYGATDQSEAQAKPQAEWEALVRSHQAFLVYGPIPVCLLAKSVDAQFAEVDIGNGLPLLWISSTSIAK